MENVFNLTKASRRRGRVVVVLLLKNACELSPAVEWRFVDCAVRTLVKSNANLPAETSQMVLVFSLLFPMFSFAGLGNLSEVFHHLAVAVRD